MAYPTHATNPDYLTRFTCAEDDIAFVMLSEILRTRSHELVEHLKSDLPDLSAIRRLALTLRLSADNLSATARPGRTDDDAAAEPALFAHTAEPASVRSIIELCSLACKQRLRDLDIELNINSLPNEEHFVNGNPWHIAYALFFSILHSGRGLAQKRSHTTHSIRDDDNAKGKTVHIRVETEADFVDILIANPSPMTPQLYNLHTSEHSDLPQSHTLSEEEWFCMQNLFARNNAHVHVESSERDGFGPFCVVIRLPTFQPGHEEPLDFLTTSESLPSDGRF